VSWINLENDFQKWIFRSLVSAAGIALLCWLWPGNYWDNRSPIELFDMKMEKAFGKALDSEKTKYQATTGTILVLGRSTVSTVAGCPRFAVVCSRTWEQRTWISLGIPIE